MSSRLKSLPVFARLYVSTMTATGAALLVAFSAAPPPDRIPEFLGLVLARVLISAFKLQLPVPKSHMTMSVSFVFDFTSLLLFGVGPTLPVAAVGALSQSTLRAIDRNPPYRVLFNIACLVITVQVTGLVYRAFGGTTGRLVSLQSATPLAAALIVYFLVNSACLSVAVALATKQRVSQVWRYNFLWGAPTYFIGGSLAALTAEALHDRAWGFMPMAAIQLYMTYQACKVYVGRLQDEQRHRDVIASLHEGMAVLGRDRRVVLWNDALERITGISRRLAVGRRLADVVQVLAETRLPSVIDTVFESGRDETLEEFALPCETGARILTVRLVPFTDGLTIFWIDITDRAKAERALKRSEERYALAAAGANDGLWDWDLDRDEAYFSSRWKTMVGLPPDARCAHIDEWLERVHPHDRASLKAALDLHLADVTVPFQHEHRVRHEDGTYRWMLCRGIAVQDPDHRVVRMAGSQSDITDRMVAQDQLRHAALHDNLTGLPNRALFMESLEQAFQRSRRHPDQRFAVLFLDIDRFKVINDTLGHLSGDTLLVGMARRLESTLRDEDVISRLGGDEFTILLNNVNEDGQAVVIAERIHEALRAPFMVQACELHTSVSIGIALSAAHYTRPEQVMRDADVAMYRAKGLGTARQYVFDTADAVSL